MARYVAFLRGINVGGNKPIKMEKLKKAFESIGFGNVKTILASGNVLFDTEEKDNAHVAQKIERLMEKEFGHNAGTTVRSMDQIQDIVKANPFKNLKITPQTRLYVTFFQEKPSKVKVQHESPDKYFTIIGATEGELFTVLTLSENRGTVDFMGFMDKEFGKKITTRNWNTINRIVTSG